jgi:dTDP-4-amino-4,6-dideoxygalactose transaminase
VSAGRPPRIPFARPALGEEEIAEVVDTLRSGWLTTGPKTARFETEFAAAIGVPHALATNSCTGALHLALEALGVGPGDEVITSTFTFAATANVIVHCGARPVFADVDPATLCLDPADVEARMGPRTRAVVAVHYAGQMADVRALRALCDARGLFLVEDAAHALGASLDGGNAGTWGDAAGFSFYANKNLTTGEGGMLTTPRADVLLRARPLRLQGMSRDVYRRSGGDAGPEAFPSWRYEIVAAGHKYPMSDVQAALGIHQLRKLDGFQAARRRLAARYRAGLARVPGLSLPPESPPGMVHAYHLFVVRIARDAWLDRDRLFSELTARGIEPSVHFVPLHLQPYFQEAWHTRAGEYPRAEAAFAEVLSLPLFPTLAEADQDRVIEEIAGLMGGSAAAP